MLQSVLHIMAEDLAELLRKTERAHKAYELRSPNSAALVEWPDWYAAFILNELALRKPAAASADHLKLHDL